MKLGYIVVLKPYIKTTDELEAYFQSFRYSKSISGLWNPLRPPLLILYSSFEQAKLRTKPDAVIIALNIAHLPEAEFYQELNSKAKQSLKKEDIHQVYEKSGQIIFSKDEYEIKKIQLQTLKSVIKLIEDEKFELKSDLSKIKYTEGKNSGKIKTVSKSAAVIHTLAVKTFHFFSSEKFSLFCQKASGFIKTDIEQATHYKPSFWNFLQGKGQNSPTQMYSKIAVLIENAPGSPLLKDEQPSPIPTP